MSKKYIPHPPQGYFEFLTLLIRYVYFDVNGVFLKTTINQNAYGKFLKKNQSTISNYVNKAINEGLIEVVEKGYFSKKQQFPSTIYGVNYNCIMNYLISHKKNPFSDMKKAKKQIIDFGKSLRTETKKERNLRLKKKKVNNARKDEVHIHFNQVLRENNRRLIEQNLCEFVDTYLDDYKLRATNPLCTTINPENHKDDIHCNDTERYELLKKFNINNPVEFDVNGSIYRLTYNITHKQQLSQEKDIYALFWQHTGINKALTKEVRNSIKAVCMPIYMKEQAITTTVYQFNSIQQYEEEKNNPQISNNSIKNIIVEPTKQELRRYEANKFLTEYTGLSLREILKKIAKGMHEVLSIERFFGRDIFLYESDLHAEMKSKMMEKGIRVINVYDGFYFEQGDITEEEFFEYYFDAVNELKKYISVRDRIQNQEYDTYYEDMEYNDDIDYMDFGDDEDCIEDYMDW